MFAPQTWIGPLPTAMLIGCSVEEQPVNSETATMGQRKFKWSVYLRWVSLCFTYPTVSVLALDLLPSERLRCQHVLAIIFSRIQHGIRGKMQDHSHGYYASHQY